MKLLYPVYVVVLFIVLVDAGPAAFTACISACNAGATKCYIALGSVFGVGSIPACIAAQSACMIACAGVGASPTP